MDGSATEPTTLDDWEAALHEPEDFSELDSEPTAEAEPQPAEVEAEPEGSSAVAGTDAEDEAEVGVAETTDATAEGDAAVAEGDGEGTPEPDVPGAKPEAVAPDGPTDDDQPAPDQATPFVLKADGVEVEVEGATISADGVISMDRETWQRKVQPYLANRGALDSRYKTQIADIQRRLDATQSERSDSEAKADKLVAHFEGLLGQGPDAVWKWLQDFEANRPALEAELRAATAEQRVEALESETQRYATEQQIEAYQNWWPDYLDQAVNSFVEHDEFKELGLDAAEIGETLRAFGDHRLFYTAGEDLPNLGAKKGDIVLDWEFVGRHIQSYANTVRKLKSQNEVVAAAEAANRKSLAAVPEAPPAIPSAGAPVPSSSKRKRPTSRDEWEAEIEALEAD